MRRQRIRIFNHRCLLPPVGALLAAVTVVAASCGGGEDTSTSEQAALLSRCPDPLVFQTDWYPEPEHGAVYNLVGDGGRFDPETGRFTGPLIADPSINVEIRSGGPVTGDVPTIDVMAADPDIFLGYVNTDEAVAAYDRHPSTAVVAPLEINPQIIMWDPETYEIESWRDVQEDRGRHQSLRRRLLSRVSARRRTGDREPTGGPLQRIARPVHRG